jgi:hypothetical protein
MRAINGIPMDDGVDEPWTCPQCGLTDELCDCIEYGAEVEQKYGSIPLLKIAVSALHKLLVKKGIVTEAELQKSFAEMAEMAE